MHFRKTAQLIKNLISANLIQNVGFRIYIIIILNKTVMKYNKLSLPLLHQMFAHISKKLGDIQYMNILIYTLKIKFFVWQYFPSYFMFKPIWISWVYISLLVRMPISFNWSSFMDMNIGNNC